MKNIKEFFGIFWSFIFLFLLSVTLEGLVFSYLWLWFVTPFGVKAISILHAFGICVMIDFVSYRYYDYVRNDVGLATSINYLLIRPLMALTTGFLLKLLMGVL
jgi:hypothetical protein